MAKAKEKKIAIKMSFEDWQEIIATIESKRHEVKDAKEVDSGTNYDPAFFDLWLADLDRIRKEIDKALDNWIDKG